MDERFSRQSFLGNNATRVFDEACTVAIIGLGGGGSHVAQQLAHLGVRRLRLFDQDRAELSNLNRLIGASFADTLNSTAKVKIAERLILAINPEADVETHTGMWQSSAEALRDCDVIFSCVDSYLARQDLEVTARRYLIPLIDIGMDVFLVEGQPHIAGQVILSIPNGPCMRCTGFLTDENLRREAEQYGASGGRPQVVWSNGILASAAVGIFADLVTGWNGISESGAYLHFDGNRNFLWSSPRLEHAPEKCIHFPPQSVGEPSFQ